MTAKGPIREALKARILKEHSKRQTVRITGWIGADPERFRELMELFLHDERVVTQRAAWIIGHCGERHPGLIMPWLGEILKKIQEPGVHDAVPRNMIRFLAGIDIPRKFLGTAVSLCFDYAASPSRPIAVRVHALSVLERAARKEPDLKAELRAVIQQMLPGGGPGLRACARHVLKGLGAPAQTEHQRR
jgi:hypothetical protein